MTSTITRRSAPLVSVYLPTFNRRELLERAVNSVLCQTHSKIELIVVDDRSSDGTSALLKDLRRRDSRIIYIVKPESQKRGAPRSRNIALGVASGEFITGLDDDDYYSPDRIARFVESWGEAIVGLYSDAAYIESRVRLKAGLRRPDRVSAADLLIYNYIGSQIFTRTDYLRSVGGFDERFLMWQDLECWFRLLKKFGDAYRVPGETYYVDMSHASSRISLQGASVERFACEQFSEKHQLNQFERKCLMSQFYGDYPKLIPLSDLFTLFVSGDGRVRRKAFKLLLRKIQFTVLSCKG